MNRTRLDREQIGVIRKDARPNRVLSIAGRCLEWRVTSGCLGIESKPPPWRHAVLPWDLYGTEKRVSFIDELKFLHFHPFTYDSI
jgi:hypothetical protein